MEPGEFIAILENFPAEYGSIREIQHFTDDPRFILIFQDTSDNWSIRRSIGEAILYYRWIKIIGVESASQQIDTSLLYSIPSDSIRKKVTFWFLKRLLLSPGEYAHIRRGDEFIILEGVEDQKSYKHAHKLFTSGKQKEYLIYQIDRSHAMTKNLLKLMKKYQETFSVLICGGDLPDLVSEKLEKIKISYAIIRPQMTYPSDLEQLKRVLNGWQPDWDEVLNLPDENYIEPDNLNFPDKRNEEYREEFRKNLIKITNSGDLSSLFKNYLPKPESKKLLKILNNKKYGLKTKSVLIKSVLISYMDTIEGKDK